MSRAKWAAEWEVQTLRRNIFQWHKGKKKSQSEWWFLFLGSHGQNTLPSPTGTNSHEMKPFLPFYELSVPVMHKSCVYYTLQAPTGNRLSQRARWAQQCLSGRGGNQLRAVKPGAQGITPWLYTKPALTHYTSPAAQSHRVVALSTNPFSKRKQGYCN